MKQIKRIIGFICIFILTVFIFTFLLSPPSGLRVLLKEAKTNEYDTLILGESHGECGYNPYIISDELGVNAVNVSRRIIPINFFYYMIKEANKKGNYKTVIIDIDPQYFIVSQDREQGADMNLFPYLTGFNRWEYFKAVMWPKKNIVLFADYLLDEKTIQKIPVCVSSKLDWDYIQNNDKAMESVNKYLNTGNAFAYFGRGYFYGVNYAENTNEEWRYESDIQLENVDVIDKINEYCKENDIRLICVQSAYSPIVIHSQRIGDIHRDISAIMEERGIEFYDLNYVKKEYLDRTPFDYVDWTEHPLGEFSTKQTNVLCDIIKSDDKNKYFYNTEEEVLNNYV